MISVWMCSRSGETLSLELDDKSDEPQADRRFRLSAAELEWASNGGLSLSRYITPLGVLQVVH